MGGKPLVRNLKAFQRHLFRIPDIFFYKLVALDESGILLFQLKNFKSELNSIISIKHVKWELIVC